MEPKYLTLIQLAAIAFVLTLVVVIKERPEASDRSTAQVVIAE